uniref:M superfamily MLKM group conopeptide Ts3-G01 n=1 Tax=Conus tessulatus TaxID=101317 RepID=H2BKB0_CONTS|nr:M superfamily MLKM group conopeptide Ts3-G01 [Conus tessulatus]
MGLVLFIFLVLFPLATLHLKADQRVERQQDLNVGDTRGIMRHAMSEGTSLRGCCTGSACWNNPTCGCCDD